MRDSLKFLFLFLISLYQVFISSFTLPTCKFYPSCSCYGKQSIVRYGPFLGGLLTFLRLLRCNPFSKGGYDPVPLSFKLNLLRCNHE